MKQLHGMINGVENNLSVYKKKKHAPFLSATTVKCYLHTDRSGCGSGGRAGRLMLMVAV